MERRRYKNPPIEEALCEFRFEAGQNLEPLDIASNMRDALKHDYTKLRQQNVMGVTFQPGHHLSMEGKMPRAQLKTEDEKRMISVGQDSLVIHILRPYQYPDNPENGGWDEDFYPRIKKALDAYDKVATIGKIIRIGVRYINKVVIPESAPKFDKYFNYNLPHKEGLPEVRNNFFFRTEYEQKSDEIKLLLNLASVAAPENSSAFILDLDVFWEKADGADGLDKTSALVKANLLREKERTFFEVMITDDTRKLFEPM